MDVTKKRALCIAVRNPYPVSGGDQVRLVQQLEMLADMYDVDLLYVTHDRNAETALKNLPALRSEHAFYIPKWQRYLQALRFTVNRRPISVNHHTNRNACKAASRMARENSYDLVFVNTPLAAIYARGIKAPLKLLDAVDSFAMNAANGLRNARTPFRRLWYSIQAPRLLRFEQRCLKEFDRVSFISDVDLRYIDPTASKSHIVGNFVDTGYWKPDDNTRPSDRPVVSFMGKMSYEPNILAVTYFAEHVFPVLRSSHPNLEFRIIGARPAEAVKALADVPGITVTGFVDDPRPLLRESAVIVAPMLSGSGIQNKILFAMSAGCCVVTTPTGAEGMAPYGDALTVCGPDNMAAAILSLLDNRTRRDDISRKARKYILDNYSRDIVRQQFKQFIEGR